MTTLTLPLIEVADKYLDNLANAVKIIDYPHHEIHDGRHFYIEGHTTLDDGDPDPATGTLYVKLVTPDTARWSHFTWDIVSNGILETRFYEGSSGGMADGSNVTPLNNNRNSSNTSGMTITSGVTVATTLGTLISNRKVGGAGFKSTFGGQSSRDDEIILKQNTTYLRSFVRSSDANVVAFKAMWYEHVSR